jgi:hypothetical protein
MSPRLLGVPGSGIKPFLGLYDPDFDWGDYLAVVDALASLPKEGESAHEIHQERRDQQETALHLPRDLLVPIQQGLSRQEVSFE